MKRIIAITAYNGNILIYVKSFKYTKSMRYSFTTTTNKNMAFDFKNKHNAFRYLANRVHSNRRNWEIESVEIEGETSESLGRVTPGKREAVK